MGFGVRGAPKGSLLTARHEGLRTTVFRLNPGSYRACLFTCQLSFADLGLEGFEVVRDLEYGSPGSQSGSFYLPCWEGGGCGFLHKSSRNKRF